VNATVSGRSRFAYIAEKKRRAAKKYIANAAIANLASIGASIRILELINANTRNKPAISLDLDGVPSGDSKCVLAAPA
jgi:hypothetical protein